MREERDSDSSMREEAGSESSAVGQIKFLTNERREFLYLEFVHPTQYDSCLPLKEAIATREANM